MDQNYIKNRKKIDFFMILKNEIDVFTKKISLRGVEVEIWNDEM